MRQIVSFVAILLINTAPILAKDLQYWMPGDKNYSHLGTDVDGAGDFNQDGVQDFVVGSSRIASIDPVRIMSGKTRTVLWEKRGETASFGYRVAGGADLDQDEVLDVLIADVETIYAYSGKGFLIWAHNEPEVMIGFDMEVVGDVDEDGVRDIIAGAPNESMVRMISGRDGTTIWQRNGHGNDEFGYSVSGAGDKNQDGIEDVVIGAPARGGGIGFIHVIDGVNGSPLWNYTFSIAGRFGHSVDGGHDVTGDGLPDVLVGAPDSDWEGEQSGFVFVLKSEGGFDIYLGEAQSHYGTCVRMIPSHTDDETWDFLISAPQAFWYEDFSLHYGRVTLVDGQTKAILDTQRGVHGQHRAFGTSMCTIGDVDGNGRADFVVTDPEYSNESPNQGSVMVYADS